MAAYNPRNNVDFGGRSGIIELNRKEDLFRKIDISELELPLTVKSVFEISNKYGIPTDGKWFLIEKDEEYFSIPMYGRTDKIDIGRIDLYPRAFLSEEDMAKTLLHEHAHYKQLQKYGAKYCEDNVSKMEKVAYRYEKMWYNSIRRRIAQ